MNTRSPFVSVLLLIGIILSACGPSQANLDVRATQVAASIFATQTAQAPTVTPTFTPSPTPTATATATPTSTPTNTPTPTPTPTQALPTATASPTPKPTLPPASPAPTKPPTAIAPTRPPASPAPTKPPTAVAPTRPPAAPGVDVVAERGKETCINKYVSVSYPWEAEQEPQGRKMFYWDEKWSVYPMFARPNIKFRTVLADCNEDQQCKGFTADFCVYVDGGAPPGGSYETEVSLIVASAYPPDRLNGPIRGPKLLATTVAKFSWLIK